MGHRVYQACWRDAFSGRVVGWRVSESSQTDLILTAFNRVVAVCQSPPGLLVYADRGSQYTNEAFTILLDFIKAIASLSRPGLERLEYGTNRVAASWRQLCRHGRDPTRTGRVPRPLLQYIATVLRLRLLLPARN